MNGGYDCEVVVVGLGAMGSCALWSLARRGVHAIGLDQFNPPHEQGSSHGETRLIRSAMLEGPAYVPLIRRAFELWGELGNESSQALFVRAGVLFISPPGASKMAALAAKALDTVGLPHQALSGEDLLARYPQHRDVSGLVATFDPSGGFVRPEQTISGALQVAEARGATVLRETNVSALSNGTQGGIVVETSRGPVTARRAVISVGAWLPTLLGKSAPPVSIERQIFAYFELDGSTSYAPQDFPPFMREDTLGARGIGPHGWLSHGLSGFPSLDGSHMKLVLLEAGRPTTMDSLDRRVSEAQLEALKASEVDTRLGGLSRPVAGSGRACLYTNAPDRNFIVGPLPDQPNMILLSACSGHGFEFAPAVGELGADLATATPPRVPTHAFSPTRLTP
ncbi:MAG: N-methyl-L-tryptophan oxidase [Chloroflexota bacterium]|nr:N-methyl-L-tryptophan oxidase [Chloroflexota bacterium]